MNLYKNHIKYFLYNFHEKVVYIAEHHIKDNLHVIFHGIF
jgi:hypothetical protein